jgi:hypothetical protein
VPTGRHRSAPFCCRSRCDDSSCRRVWSRLRGDRPLADELVGNFRRDRRQRGVRRESGYPP